MQKKFRKWEATNYPLPLTNVLHMGKKRRYVCVCVSGVGGIEFKRFRRHINCNVCVLVDPDSNKVLKNYVVVVEI